MSFLDSVAEGVGSALKPIAPALDFMGLGPDTMPDTGSVWEAVGQGAKNALMASPAGVATGAASLYQGFNDLSARDRLLFGGLLIAGGIGAARQAHARWGGNAMPERLLAPTGLAEMENIGLKHNFQELNGVAADLARVKPGIRGRQAALLGAADGLEFGRAMARSDDPLAHAGIAGVFDRYSGSHPDGPGGALSDFARADHAVDHRLLAGAVNKPFRDVYAKFTAGNPLTEEETSKLLSGVQAIGDATNAIDADDLTVGLTGRISGIDLTDGGATLHVSFKAPEVGDLWNDELYRAKALTTLNVRSYAEQGKKNFRYLYDAGMADIDARANGRTPLLPTALERGPDWYFAEHDNIAKAFGIGKADVVTPEFQRAVAVTSILSEAQLWEKNIQLAKRMSDTVFDRTEVLDDDFQNWLQDGTLADHRNTNSRREYVGTKAKQHESTLEALHQELTSQGFTVPKETVGKVLRLARETPDEVFLGSGADKQKNFYLNLLSPDLEYPITVDMHQFDAFYGIDSGTKDRPVGDSIVAGENNYGVIADIVRSVAHDITEETGQKVLPHQVQAVIWETWRSLKFDHNGGWGKGDPFRIKPPGGENPVFLALQGKGMDEVPASLFGSQTDLIPVATLEAGARDFDAILSPEGSAVYATDVTPYTDQVARHLYPTILGADGVPRWAETRPRWVDDANHIRQTVAGDEWAHIETFDARQLAGAVGLYPGHAAPDVIMFDAPSVLSTKGWPGRNQFQPIGGVEVDKVARDHTMIHSTSINSTDHAEELLANNAWVVIDNPGAANRLRYTGFDPIRTNDGDHWIVFGPTEAQAKAAGSTSVFSHAGERPQGELKASAGDVVDVIKNNPDGFTYNLQTGEAASSGKAVAELGGELRVKPEDLDEDLIDKYIEDHRAWLARPGMHLGGWYNSADGTYSLDVTKVHSSDTPVADVMQHMDVNKQEAAFNLDTFEKVRNPKWETYDMAGRARPELEFRFDVPGDYGGTVTVKPGLNAADPELARATAQRTKHMVVVDRSELPSLELLASDLERRGASNLQVHTTRTDLAGFDKARAHTYTDGSQFVMQLTRDDTFGVANSVPVWVRSNHNLPDAPTLAASVKPAADGAVLNNSVRLKGADSLKSGQWTVDSEAWVMTHGEGPVTNSGKKWTIELGDQSDLSGVIKQAEVLQTAGVPKDAIEIKTDQGRFKLQKDVVPTVKDTVVRKVKWGGEPVVRNRNMSDDDVMVGQFRISPKFKVQKGGRLVDAALDTSTVDSARRALETFLEQHERAAEVWRFPGVHVDSDDLGALAFTNWEPGSPIHLTKDWWAQPGQARSMIEGSVASKYFADYGDDAVAGLITHELGHVFHGGLALQEGWKVDPEVNKIIRKIAKKHGLDGIMKGLSRYAATNESELIAESVANVLQGKRVSPIAREVYDVVTGRFEDAFKYRGLLWKTA